MTARKTKRVALVGFPVAQIGKSELNRMLVTFAETHRWELIANTVDSPVIMQVLPEIGCDGALVRVTNDAMRAACLAAPFPVVNYSTWLEDPGVPTVCRDDRALGVLAAKHLLGKGFRRFGAVVLHGGWYIQSRIEGFSDTITQAGGEFHTLRFLSSHPAARDISHLAAGLKKLPHPVGLLISDCKYAKHVYAAAEQAGLKIPLDIAVVAVNREPTNDDPLSPSLTISAPGDTHYSLEAVKLLNRLMNGGVAKRLITRLPPLGILPGESTGISCYEDRITAEAVDFVRRHAGEPVNATDIATALGVGSATLSRHCREHLGMGPYEYLCAVRVERAADILKKQPELSLEAIAQAVGMPGRNRFNKVFRRLRGISPADWRSQHAQ